MDNFSMKKFFWTQMEDIGPSRRVGHSMCYDSDKVEILLFGGLTIASAPGTVFLGDTWVWKENVWTQMADTGPSPRDGFDLVYDSSRKKAILFGGRSGYYQTDVLNDTWEWDGSAWTKVADTGPTARRNPRMAYDSARQKVVLFGGIPFNGPMLNDTWEWDGSAWTKVADTGPSGRHAHRPTTSPRISYCYLAEQVLR
jgi:hypothetical protein